MHFETKQNWLLLTTNSKSCSTVSISRATLGAALRAGVAGPVGGGGAQGGAHLIWKLDNGEKRKDF